MSKGRVTIPTDDNFIKETMEIAEKWGAMGLEIVMDLSYQKK